MISEGPKRSRMVRDQKLEIAYIYGWECCAEVNIIVLQAMLHTRCND